MLSNVYDSLSKPQRRSERLLRKWLFKRGIVNTIEEAYAFITGRGNIVKRDDSIDDTTSKVGS
jgi:hypothetical protein